MTRIIENIEQPAIVANGDVTSPRISNPPVVGSKPTGCIEKTSLFDLPCSAFDSASAANPVIGPHGIVLSLCDRTGNMVKPWAFAGHECWCIDLQHLGDVTTAHGAGSIRYIGADILKWVPPLASYRIVFAFPPCTNMAVSGARWFRDKGLRGIIDALELVERCRLVCEWTSSPWMLENPVSTLSTYWRKPDHIFNPCDYGGYLQPAGDAYTKKTCLWTGGGFVMPEKRPVAPLEGSKIHLMPPSEDRGNLRSITPMGFAEAVYQANCGAADFKSTASFPNHRKNIEHTPRPIIAGCAGGAIYTTVISKQRDEDIAGAEDELMTVDQPIISILDQSRIEGTTLFLPPTRLDRQTYTKVAKVIEAIGGKWNRKAQGHVFDHDPQVELEDVILSGEVENRKQVMEFFETPLAIAERLVDMADLRKGHTVLEPSAGRGAIAKVIKQAQADISLQCVELDEHHRDRLLSTHSDSIFTDFFAYKPKTLFDRIVANPPFARQQDIDHVLHMHHCLAWGGKLVSVMAAGVLFRDNRKSVEFRKFVSENDGSLERLPDHSFHDSGTDVNTCVVTIYKGVSMTHRHRHSTILHANERFTTAHNSRREFTDLCDLLTDSEIALLLEMDSTWRLPIGCAHSGLRMARAKKLVRRTHMMEAA